MPRRHTLAAATLLLTLPLASCTSSSPEAGRPDTTPPLSTPIPSAPTTSQWTEEEQAAIDAAKVRYASARRAVDTTLHDPRKSDRTALTRAGNGGTWLIDVLGEIKFQRENGWYQTGFVQIGSVSVDSVKLTLEQPEVRLTACIDSSKVTTNLRSTGKPIPDSGNDGDRHVATAKLVFAQALDEKAKAWFLVEEKGGGTC
ncbi:hypothetical protein [Kribbella italica]|uniref:Lipoprotein n=1 Tax=Kribbella italica TaxID=1540520 RepID=A0A7W9MS37_9ACTN|nr:hypothetical protein [Kribbella italica]MBB5833747.1 hypothetical protein [Kribbella italica]